MNEKCVEWATWIDVFYLSVIITILYPLGPNLQKQGIWMSHSCAPSPIEDTNEHELRAFIFQSLLIAGFEPAKTSTSQTLRSEPMSDQPFLMVC